MKNILFVRHGYYPTDVRVRKQVKALSDLGHKIEIICLQEKGEKRSEIIDGVRIVRFPFQHRRSSLLWYLFEYSIGFILFFSIISVKSLIERYDYIIVHTLPDFLSLTTIIPRIFGVKVVTDFHEPTPELIMTKYNFSNKHILVKLALLIEQLINKYSFFSITVTKELRDRYIYSGADPDKVFVISNAIDESFFKVDTSKVLKQKSEYFRIITHGTIEERYGHETVIRAISLLKDKFPNIRFIITGDGTYTKHLKSLVKKLSCENHVEFLGYLPFNELLESLVNANVGIISMHKNPYSMLIDTNKMYEYFELGLPVILPKLAPLQNSFNSKEVIFFEPGNYNDLAKVLESILSSGLKLDSFVRNASEKYDMLKWSKVKNSFTGLFK